MPKAVRCRGQKQAEKKNISGPRKQAYVAGTMAKLRKKKQPKTAEY